MRLKSFVTTLILLGGISAGYVATAEEVKAQDSTIFAGAPEKFDALTNENWWKVDRWGGNCLSDGAPCHDNPGSCCSGRCIFVNHGTDYCEYGGHGGGGGGWGGGGHGGGWGGGGHGGGWNCLRSGTPCHKSRTPCCTQCVVVNHGTDYCAY